MSQITKGFCEQMLVHASRKEHSPLTVWEEEQLARAWLKLNAAAPTPEPADFCATCKGSGEVEDLIEHVSGDPQDSYSGIVPCQKCGGTGEPAEQRTADANQCGSCGEPDDGKCVCARAGSAAPAMLTNEQIDVLEKYGPSRKDLERLCAQAKIAKQFSAEPWGWANEAGSHIATNAQKSQLIGGYFRYLNVPLHARTGGK